VSRIRGIMANNEELYDFIVNKLDTTNEFDYQNDWKFGFIIALNCQKFFLNSGNSIEKIKDYDPWQFEEDIELIYDHFSEYMEKEFDDVMEDFVANWIKIEHKDPLYKAFNIANSELKTWDTSSAKAKSKKNDKLVKRICEIMAEEINIFFIPTRTLGSLLGKSRQYAAIKLKKLVDENYIIEVNKGNRRNSPHYKIKPEQIDSNDVEIPF
jgi:hypothetical protein